MPIQSYLQPWRNGRSPSRLPQVILSACCKMCIRDRMMVCLPLVGAVVGGLWALAAWLLGRIDCPAPVQEMCIRDRASSVCSVRIIPLV